MCFLRKCSQFFSPVTSSESTQEKRKRKRGNSGGRVDSEEDAKKKKRESQRPNYFISIPITNTQVRIKCILKNERSHFHQVTFCLTTDQFSGEQCPGGRASAGAPARQSHGSYPNTPHHSFSHSPFQPGASRSVSGYKHTQSWLHLCAQPHYLVIEVGSVKGPVFCLFMQELLTYLSYFY